MQSLPLNIPANQRSKLRCYSLCVRLGLGDDDICATNGILQVNKSIESLCGGGGGSVVLVLMMSYIRFECNV